MSPIPEALWVPVDTTGSRVSPHGDPVRLYFLHQPSAAFQTEAMFPKQLLAEEHRITRIEDRESGEKDVRGANRIFSAITVVAGSPLHSFQ
jgi:hypothetical protein